MKASNYNFFFPYKEDNSKLIAYNSFSNALALMDRQQHSIFKNYCDNSVEIEDEEFLSQLKLGNFLIEDNFNEKDILRINMLNNRYSTSSLGLTIAPTADCNFRCPYCYEKDALCPQYMSSDVQDKIIELIKNQANTISVLSVSWYGGEPLMGIKAIERMSRAFIKICEENNITYFASIVTNGYYLTRKNVELLNELKITSMQVTLDGAKEVHNQRRPLKGGLPTFDIIINNLVQSKDILPYTSIRINVDMDNILSAKEVVQLLKEKEMPDYVVPYLGRILPDNGTYDASRCFDTCDFSQKDYEFKAQIEDDTNYITNYPTSISNVCTADKQNSFVIGADGGLYKCWMDIGNYDKCIGNILDGSITNQNILLDYMLHDPTTDPMCGNCKLLPVCMSGCPVKRIEGEESCTKYKYLLNQYLTNITKNIKKQQELTNN